MPPKSFRRRVVPSGGGNSMQASMKAAFQQRDSTQIVINSTESVTLAVPANSNGSTIVRNVTKLLCSTEFFQHYAAMYDQFKIDGVSVSAEIVYNTFGQAAMTFPNVISAWDRNGIDKATASVTFSGVTQTNAPVVPGPYQVASYSSAVSRAYYPGARWGITRRLVASSLQEKSIYLPTVKTAEVMTESSLYAAWNPDFLLSVLLGANTPTCQSLVFNLSWSWVLSLRGLRKTSLDVISTPLPGTVGYAPSNAGTIASGTDNAMIPVVRATQKGTDITTTPLYSSNVQSYEGVQNATAVYVNDVFKYTINHVLAKVGGNDMSFLPCMSSMFTVINPNSADVPIIVEPGTPDVIKCRLVIIIREEDSSVKGYHVYPTLLMNAGHATLSPQQATGVVALGNGALRTSWINAGILDDDDDSLVADYDKLKVVFRNSASRTVLYSKTFSIMAANRLNYTTIEEGVGVPVNNDINYQYTIGNSTVSYPVANSLVSSYPVVGADAGHTVVPVVPGPLLEFTNVVDQIQTDFSGVKCAGASKLRDIFCTSVYFNDEVFLNTR